MRKELTWIVQHADYRNLSKIGNKNRKAKKDGLIENLTKQAKTKVEERLIKPFLHIVENEPAEKKSSLLLAAGLGERSEGSWGE